MNYDILEDEEDEYLLDSFRPPTGVNHYESQLQILID